MKPTDINAFFDDLEIDDKAITKNIVYANKGAPKKGISLSAECRAKMSNTLKGKAHSDEHSAKIASALKGKAKSDEARAKMSAAASARVVGADVLEKRGMTFKGKQHSDETKARMSESMRNAKRATFTCVHCKKTTICMARRFHNDNCKQNPNKAR
jgi:hypothetical protein